MSSQKPLTAHTLCEVAAGNYNSELQYGHIHNHQPLTACCPKPQAADTLPSFVSSRPVQPTRLQNQTTKNVTSRHVTKSEKLR
jgi:hypothetical protein